MSDIDEVIDEQLGNARYALDRINEERFMSYEDAILTSIRSIRSLIEAVELMRKQAESREEGWLEYHRGDDW